MFKHQVRNLLIVITPCLGWALVQPALAADAKTSSTFKEAFAAARKAGNETFEWNGKKYITTKKATAKETAAKGKAAAKDDIKATGVATPAAAAAAPAAAKPAAAATTVTAMPVVAPVAAPVAVIPAPQATPTTATAKNTVSSVPPFVFAPVSISPSAPAFVASIPTPWSPRPNPYIVQPVTVTVATPPATFPWQAQVATPAPSIAQAPATPAAPFAFGQDSYNAKDANKSRSILPTITKVYPTGEKPMVVVTFNCPTEMAGVATPTTKIIHSFFDLGFSAINATNALPWTLQQVCS